METWIDHNFELKQFQMGILYQFQSYNGNLEHTFERIMIMTG